MANSSLDRLTERQRNVLFLVCNGFHNTEIAGHVGISPRMVKECVSQLLLIYEVSNRTELVGFRGPEVEQRAAGEITGGQMAGPDGH